MEVCSWLHLPGHTLCEQPAILGSVRDCLHMCQSHLQDEDTLPHPDSVRYPGESGGNGVTHLGSGEHSWLSSQCPL